MNEPAYDSSPFSIKRVFTSRWHFLPMDSFYRDDAHSAKMASALELRTSMRRVALDREGSPDWTLLETGNYGQVPAPLQGRMRLRPAQDDDAKDIAGLIANIWSEYPGKILNVSRDMPELLSPATAYAARDGLFWIIEEAHEIAGTVACIPSADDSCMELQKLYVRRISRRRGYGELLCGSVEREAVRRSLRAVELWSDTKLLDAHRLYERLGYRRDEAPRFCKDASNTVRYRYSKILEPDPALFHKHNIPSCFG